jgi:hypothetical protein
MIRPLVRSTSSSLGESADVRGPREEAWARLERRLDRFSTVVVHPLKRAIRAKGAGSGVSQLPGTQANGARVATTK